MNTAPTVQAHPVFKVGETARCKSTGSEFKIVRITDAGDLECEGRAGLMPKSAATRPLTEEQKKSLETA